MPGDQESPLPSGAPAPAKRALPETPRQNYLDNIRWGVVVLVLVYHVVFLFNATGVPTALGAKSDIRAFDTLMYVVYPWFMALLFVTAGSASRYALQSRPAKQFFTDRVIKLLVPTTLGLFVFQWTAGLFLLGMLGFLDTIPKPLRYPAVVLWSAPGHLWFIQVLFVLSVLLLLVRVIDKHDRLWRLGGKANLWVVLLLVVPVWGAAQVLNVSQWVTYRIGIYGLLFFLGYAVFSHDSVIASLTKMRLPLLVAAVALGAGYTVHYFGTDNTSLQVTGSVLTTAFAWAAILAALGCGNAWLNGRNGFTAYMTKASYGYYILHYPVVAWTCYLLYYHAHLPLVLNYVIALVVELAGTAALYELFSRIPVVRFAVLGITRRRPAPPHTPARTQQTA